jgi:hypothetical protein
VGLGQTADPGVDLVERLVALINKYCAVAAQ